MALKRPGPYVGLSANYADDEKIMDAGEDAELLYVRMLAYAARTPLTEGWISDSVLRARLGILPRDAHDVTGNVTGIVPGTDALSRAEKLREVGLLVRDGGGWRIATWLKWNRSIEEMGKERHRDTKRKGALTSGSPETGRETARETGRETTQIPGSNDQDQDQDHVEGPRKRGRRKRSIPLPANWEPNTNHHRQAKDEGIDIAAQAKKFRNWAEARDQRYADWDAAFRNWLDSDLTPRSTLPPGKRSERGSNPFGATSPDELKFHDE